MCNIFTLKWTIIKCKESYLTICWGVVYTAFQLHPSEGSRDEAHRENEFDSPAMESFLFLTHGSSCKMLFCSQLFLYLRNILSFSNYFVDDPQVGKAKGVLKNFLIEPFVPHKQVKLSLRISTSQFWHYYTHSHSYQHQQQRQRRTSGGETSCVSY